VTFGVNIIVPYHHLQASTEVYFEVLKYFFKSIFNSRYISLINACFV